MGANFSTQTTYLLPIFNRDSSFSQLCNLQKPEEKSSSCSQKYMNCLTRIRRCFLQNKNSYKYNKCFALLSNFRVHLYLGVGTLGLLKGTPVENLMRHKGVLGEEKNASTLMTNQSLWNWRCTSSDHIMLMSN